MKEKSSPNETEFERVIRASYKYVKVEDKVLFGKRQVVGRWVNKDTAGHRYQPRHLTPSTSPTRPLHHPIHFDGAN